MELTDRKKQILKIVVDGYERVERYQFYLDENGEWVFEKVDLASFGKV